MEEHGVPLQRWALMAAPAPATLQEGGTAFGPSIPGARRLRGPLPGLSLHTSPQPTGQGFCQ